MELKGFKFQIGDSKREVYAGVVEHEIEGPSIGVLMRRSGNNLEEKDWKFASTVKTDDGFRETQFILSPEAADYLVDCLLMALSKYSIEELEKCRVEMSRLKSDSPEGP